MERFDQQNERMNRIAATVFTDEHRGRAISEEEFEADKKILEAYKQEIEQAREIIAADPQFNNLSYQEKLVYTYELINRLRIKNHGEEEIIPINSREEKVNYADLNDPLSTIPQEPYEPIFKEEDLHRSK